MVGCSKTRVVISFTILKPANSFSPVHQPTGRIQANSQYNAGQPEGQISFNASDWAGWAEARWTVIPHLPCLPRWQSQPSTVLNTHRIHFLMHIKRQSKGWYQDMPSMLNTSLLYEILLERRTRFNIWTVDLFKFTTFQFTNNKKYTIQEIEILKVTVLLSTVLSLIKHISTLQCCNMYHKCTWPSKMCLGMAFKSSKSELTNRLWKCWISLSIITE